MCWHLSGQKKVVNDQYLKESENYGGDKGNGILHRQCL